MNRNLLLLGAAAVALVAMVLGAAFTRTGGEDIGEPPDGAIIVTMASSSTKKEWIDTAVKQFNDASRSGRESFRVGGKPSRRIRWVA